MNPALFITKENFLILLSRLSNAYDVFVPVKKGEERFYRKGPVSSDEMAIGEVRPFEPLKAFFSRAREVVAEGFKDEVLPRPVKPFAIIGVKACDLKGFKIQDFVFYPESFRDPIYAKNREANLVIASDCTCAIATCFCLALGVEPFPKENFDIGLSIVKGGYVATVGSEKGEGLVKQNPDLFTEASADAISQKEDNRQRVIQAVEKNLKDFNVPREQSFSGIVMRGYHSDIWADEAKTCVECGACNTICPTCHCFLLYDQKQGASCAARSNEGRTAAGGETADMERFRIWDSCMIKDFARVAGGGNPRPKLWQRLRNRFEKKFDFFPKVANVYACTGCGRCISACPAKIDIRRVLRRLVEHV